LSAGLTGVVGGSIDMGDYDNDGDPDLVVSGFDFTSPILKIYRNNTTSFLDENLDIFQGKAVDFSSVSFIDVDNDGDLDLSTIGRMKLNETTYQSASVIYDNVSARSNPNNNPNEVTGLITAVNLDTVKMIWEPGVDEPVGDPLRDSLSYQIRIGTSIGGNEIVSGANNREFGRYGSRTMRMISGLISGTYYWNVRSVDNGKAVSDWSDTDIFIIDVDAPVVNSSAITVTPDSSGIGTTTILMVIDENFNLDYTVEPDVSVKLSNDVSLPVSKVSYTGNTWIGEIEFEDTYPSGSVSISVSDITDSFGNIMTEKTDVKIFYLDTDRPSVFSTNPPFIEGGIQKGVLTNITLTAVFDEELDPASIDDTVLKLFKGSEEVTQASSVQLDENELSVSVVYSGLESDTEYRAVAVAKIKDKVGNSLDGDFSWQFRTTKVVSARSGGSISNADSSVVLYVSPNAVNADIEIPITAVTPLNLPVDKTFTDIAYQIGPAGGMQLSKPAQLTLNLPADALMKSAVSGNDYQKSDLAIFIQNNSNPSVWDRIGGTIDLEENTITAPVSALGTFGIFEDPEGGTGSDSITDISFSPRVFSPKGSGALPRRTSINFTLGKEMPVTILIFNTSGRLVKALINNRTLNGGRQAVNWDGTDGDNRILPSGLYTVVIKSGSKTEMKTIAISNR
ncbi:Ig-like domain-containing protein, partial [candidate division KSB1 bacterium]